MYLSAKSWKGAKIILALEFILAKIEKNGFFSKLFPAIEPEAVLDAFDHGVPAEEDADEGHQADPDEGLGGVALGLVPGFDFFEHQALFFVCFSAKIALFLGKMAFFY